MTKKTKVNQKQKQHQQQKIVINIGESKKRKRRTRKPRHKESSLEAKEYAEAISKIIPKIQYNFPQHSSYNYDAQNKIPAEIQTSIPVDIPKKTSIPLDIPKKVTYTKPLIEEFNSERIPVFDNRKSENDLLNIPTSSKISTNNFEKQDKLSSLTDNLNNYSSFSPINNARAYLTMSDLTTPSSIGAFPNTTQSSDFFTAKTNEDDQNLKPEASILSSSITENIPTPNIKRRGRPVGSKNKLKESVFTRPNPNYERNKSPTKKSSFIGSLVNETVKGAKFVGENVVVPVVKESLKKVVLGK